MPVVINGQTYYRTAEVYRIVGISKNTLFQWFRQGSFADAKNRDRRGWRLFTEDEVDRLQTEANRINRMGEHYKKGRTTHCVDRRHI